MEKYIKKEFFLGIAVLAMLLILLAPTASSRAANGSILSDPNYKLIVCDGPQADSGPGSTGKVCDFNALIDQIQAIINLMVEAGVVVAIILTCYAGILYMSSNPAKREKAHSIFPKLGVGFLIMISAWFIVYQLLNWLTSNSGYMKLLGGATGN